MHHKINFRIRGEGPLLILLHGYAGSVMHWEDLIPSLEKKYSVVAINYSHFYLGRIKLSFSEQVELLKKFISTNFKNQKINIAGLSYGAALSWALAVDCPDIIEKCVFINPMPPNPVKSFSATLVRYFFKAPPQVRWTYWFFHTPVGKVFLRRAAEIFRAERLEGVGRLDALKGRKLLFVCHLIYKFSWILKNENWQSWRDKLEASDLNAQLIFDIDDPLFESESYKDFAALINCQNIIEVRDAGHIAVKEKPEPIAHAIINFI